MSEIISKESLSALPMDELEGELAEMKEQLTPEIPRIRIEHSPAGHHRMFVDQGESFLEEEARWLEGNTFRGIVVTASYVRAMFTEDEGLPVCAGVGDHPVVEDPVSDSCRDCRESTREGRCKPKVKLLMLTEEGKLVAFPLSPTSIKHWNRYVRKLGRSKLPYIAVVTNLSLQDASRNGFRWAEVTLDMERLVTLEELAEVRRIRDEAKNIGQGIDEADFRDPGDKGRQGNMTEGEQA